MDGQFLRSLGVFLAGLVLGGGVVGTSMHSGGADRGEGREEITPRLVERLPKDSPKKPSVSSVELAELRSSSERMAEVGKLADTELQRMIESILKEADPFKGFDYKQKSLLNDILDELTDRDFEGALGWVDAQLSGTLRSYAYQRVLKEHYGKERPRETLERYEAGGFEDKEVAGFAGGLLLSSEDLNSEDAIHLMRKSYHEGSSSSGSEFSVSEDFDYAAFAEAAINLELEDKERKMTFSRFPTNLFEDWMKKDAYEAMEFYNKYYLGEPSAKLSFNGIEELAEGYVTTASRQEFLGWTTEIIANPEVPVRERNELIKFLTDPDNGSQELLGEIGSAITDRDQSIEFSSVALTSTFSESNPTFYDALALFPDRESRLVELEKLAGRRYQSGKMRDGSARLFEDLAKLGHGAADIQRIATALEPDK